MYFDTPPPPQINYYTVFSHTMHHDLTVYSLLNVLGYLTIFFVINNPVTNIIIHKLLCEVLIFFV